MITYVFGENYEKIFDGIFWMEKHEDYPLYHSHTYWELVICKEGSFDHVIEGQHHALNVGDVILLAPGACHSLKALTDKVVHLNVGISAEAFEKRCNAINPEFFAFVKNYKYLKANLSFERLSKIEAHLKSVLITTDQSEISTIVSFVIFDLLEVFYTRTKSNHSEMPEWFKDLLIQCNSIEHMNWKPRDVCAYANYSQTHINRLFKKILNTTLVDYLMEIKMNNAVVLLTNSDLSLTNIVATLGYTSLSYFSHTFKKFYKVSPYKYKTNFKSKK